MGVLHTLTLRGASLPQWRRRTKKNVRRTFVRLSISVAFLTRTIIPYFTYIPMKIYKTIDAHTLTHAHTDRDSVSANVLNDRSYSNGINHPAKQLLLATIFQPK